MARIKKYADNIYPHLTDYQTLITDSNPNSEYFRITEFKDTMSGGKNGFLIEGSEHLLETTEIKIEIIDVNGDPIYFEPGDGIPEYYEGLSKLIAVHVYEDTPIGLAKITVLGELKTYVDASGNLINIPDGWKGVYNVKWERDFKVNKLLSNEDKVRFYRRPKVSIDEVVKALYSNNVVTATNTGVVSGIPLSPMDGTSLRDYKLPTSYLLSITDTTPYSAWTGSVIDNEISIPSLGYTTIAQEVISKTQLVVTNPYTDGDGVVQPFSNQNYTTTFEYIEGANNNATALTGSFAKITLTDLTSFVGDVARVKVFRKSQSDLSDYQFVQEIKLESNEILLDLITSDKNSEYYGLFTNDVINNYWDVSSPNLTTTFNESYLFNSVKLDNVSGINKFSTKNTLSINKDVEYTLSFGLRGENSSGNGYIRAFISGSKTINGNVVQIEQDFAKISAQTAILQKSTVSENIIADDLTDVKLYFEVNGSGWYISDVSLKASQETAFSPDEITFIQSVPRSLATETFLYRFEFYDINNNYIPVLVEKSKTFVGGNLQALQANLQLVPTSLYFQFDSGSNPIPPFFIGIDVVKNLLTGSVTYTSKSYDDSGIELLSTDYPTGGYPGLLNDITTDNPLLTVQNFTGSRTDKNVQYIQYTGECEGYTDTIIITKVLDGFGGVNYIIKPFNGTGIRNSSTASLEIQAVKVDGINSIDLSSTSVSSNLQLHVLSGSKFVNLHYASQSNFIKNLKTGSLGSREINYNAIFDRESINKQLLVYLMPSGSNPTSQSIVTSILLNDFQDGLDSGIITFNTDTFTINPRTQTEFTPQLAYTTASFYLRGSNTNTATANVFVYPSMSLDSDYNPHYYLYYASSNVDDTISVSATDSNGFDIPNGAIGTYTSISESKNLNIAFTYTEPFTDVTINRDKTFTIVPEGKPGDESIVYEVTPPNVVLNANAKGVVTNYSPSVTDIKLKQGSRYLLFDNSRDVGTFYILTSSIVAENITPGNIQYTSSFNVNYTSSLLISQSSNFTQLSGSITYPLIIHPYYTSSIYTGSVVQQYTKVVDGTPPIEILVTPNPIQLNSGETGTITDYRPSNTTLKVKEGNDYLLYNTSGNPGTFNIQSISATNITATNAGATSAPSASITFSSFNQLATSASVVYNVMVYPYSLGPGHRYASSLYTSTQNFTKNVSAPAARSVKLSATSTTINFDSNGVIISPTSGITLTATAYNVSGSAHFRILKDGVQKSPFTIAPLPTRKISEYTFSDYVEPGTTSTWTVELKDGGTAGSVLATDSLTFTGVVNGANAYNVQLTNDNSSVVYRIAGDTDFGNTGTNIVATKGGVALKHTGSFSPQTEDANGNPIGSIGEYQTSIYSKSSHITLGSGLSVGDIVPTVGGVAQIGNLTDWSNITTNPSASIVYKVDLENGKQILYKTQSLTVQYEGRVGPGVVFRGPWTGSLVYFDSDDSPTRRDAVLYNGTYYATKTNATTNLNKVPSSEPTFWESLGTQEYFVAAKIAIFEESYVQNTINVGTNVSGSAANIILYGNVDRPYISLGQPDGIGYGQTGYWVGTANTPVVAKMSLVNGVIGDNERYLKWDGTNLDVKGSINITGGNAATQAGVSGSITQISGSVASSLDSVSSSIETRIFTDASGKISKTPSNAGSGLYLGQSFLGYYNGSAWKTYMANNGNFYLTGSNGYLIWDAGADNLQIKGEINITGGNAATQAGVSGSITQISGSAASALTSVSSSAASSLDSVSSSIETRIFTTNAGLINKAPTPSGAGLYLGSGNLGYYNGGSWKTYMSSSGDFYLSGTSGTQGLTWIASANTLSIDGNITARSGTFYGNITSEATIRGGTVTAGIVSGSTIIGGIVSGSTFIGATGQFTGTVTATTGIFGSGTNYWILGANSIQNHTTATVLGKISLNAARPAIEVYNSSNELSVDINTNSSLSNITNGATSSPANITAQSSLSQTVSGPSPALTYESGDTPTIYTGTESTFSLPSQVGKAAAITITAGGTAGNSTISGVATNHALYTSYGFFIRKDSTTGTIVATLGERIGVSSNESSINLPTYTKTFTTSIVLENVTYYIVPFITSTNASAYADFPDNINSLTINVYTPTITSAGVSVSIGKTEIIPGGLQVVRNTDNWVKIDRSGSGPILEVKGEIQASGNITAYASSDRRLKENIKPIPNALEKIDKVNGVEFDWKVGFEKSHSYTGHDIGLIAQEVEEVLPDIVVTRDDGYKAIRYEKMVALLLQAIKELKNEILELKNK